jgi:hypothetical protein
MVYRFIKNKKGSALALIIIVVAVFSILGAALLQVSLAENKFAIHEEKRLKAYYMARSGAEAASKWVEDPTRNLSTINTLISTNTSNISNWTSFADGRFKIHFSGDEYKPTIHSVGEYDGIQQKISLSLEKNYFFDAAVTVTSQLHMQNLNNTHVYGSVAVTPTATITGNGQNNIGSLTHTTRTYPSPTDPNLPEATVSWPPPANTITSGDGYADHRFTSPVSLGNSTYYFILSGDMNIQFDSLSLSSNTEIYVSGTGTLNIYVNDINFKGRLFTTDPTVKTILTVFDNGTFDMQTGNGVFQGFIYGPNADMEISANFDSVGAIIAKTLTLQSGGNVSFASYLGNVYPEELGFSSLGYSRSVWYD